MHDVEDCNRTRHDARSPAGHYESWFVRANHPDRPLAFWIRSTIFSPAGRPQDALGEVRAIRFDGENGHHVAVKESVPLARCAFSPGALDARIGLSTLGPRHLEGRVRGGGHTLRWQLDYTGAEPPLLLLREPWYERRLPKAKALVAQPNAQFFGSVVLDGEPMRVEGWRGSQNHDWGSRHTERSAWGQVAGFDGAPDTFLECATAWLRAGPLPLPAMTVVVLRVERRTYAFNGLWQSVRATGRLAGTVWELATRSRKARVTARFEAAPEAFVALRYDDPPGGAKQCLNTKIGSCVLTLSPDGDAPRTFVSRERAAFEILADRVPEHATRDDFGPTLIEPARADDVAREPIAARGH